jgi:hypothetical protein
MLTDLFGAPFAVSKIAKEYKQACQTSTLHIGTLQDEPTKLYTELQK